MSSPPILLLAAGIGFVAGLRSFTAPAAVSWAAYLGWLNLEGSPLVFMGSMAAVAIFTILALLEYVADKLPRTPNRIARGPLLGRIATGALAGACISVSSGGFGLAGMVLGGLGALLGAFAGFEARRRLVLGLKVRDRVIALLEDVVAVVLAYVIVAS